MKVSFETESYTFYGEFNDTPTAQEIISNLPIDSVVSKWGDEIYFDMGFKVSAQDATMDINVGDIAYWSQGKSLCVFFGPTLASITAKPVPASPVVVVGKTDVSPDFLRKIQLGDKIRVCLR